MQTNPSSEPFWQDGPDLPGQLPSYPRGLTHLLVIYRIAGLIVLVGGTFLLFYYFSHILAWAWLVLMVGLYAKIIYQLGQKKQAIRRIPEIQARARLQEGASVIGSAIHVAGHPTLAREQPVVLALASEGLKLFSYTDAHPLDVISLHQLTAVQTVVYDDERVPHIDVVDNAAQALQLTVKSRQGEYICLFRRMRKVRPIDWYHELKKAQWQAGPW